MKIAFQLLWLIGFVAMYVFGGCKLADEDKETIITVDPEFTIDLFEKLGTTPEFQFKLKTIESTECQNDTINYTSQRLATKLTLSVNRIQEAPDCIPGNQPAEASAGFGNLGNGSYFVEIGLKNTIINKGKMIVSDQAYLLDMESNDGFEIVRSELNRVPRRMIWGYLAYQDKNAVGDLPSQFLADLTAISQSLILSKGYFAHFEIDENNLLKLPVPPPFPYFKTFYFRFDGNLQDIEQLLRNYRGGTTADLMEVKILTWEGKTY
jgi:hypothetical protein